MILFDSTTDISGVYLIQSIKKSKRIYIGSSKQIRKRWKNHLYKLKNGDHCSKLLQEHYNKYGKSDLMFKILVGCERSRLKEVEQFYIDCFNPYFNYDKSTGSGYHEKY